MLKKKKHSYVQDVNESCNDLALSLVLDSVSSENKQTNHCCVKCKKNKESDMVSLPSHAIRESQGHSKNIGKLAFQPLTAINQRDSRNRDRQQQFYLPDALGSRLGIYLHSKVSMTQECSSTSDLKDNPSMSNDAHNEPGRHIYDTYSIPQRPQTAATVPIFEKGNKSVLSRCDSGRGSMDSQPSRAGSMSSVCSSLSEDCKSSYNTTPCTSFQQFRSPSNALPPEGGFKTRYLPINSQLASKPMPKMRSSSHPNRADESSNRNERELHQEYSLLSRNDSGRGSIESCRSIEGSTTGSFTSQPTKIPVTKATPLAFPRLKNPNSTAHQGFKSGFSKFNHGKNQIVQKQMPQTTSSSHSS